MARQHRFAERFRSIAGGALVGLGLHLLFGNLDQAAAQLNQIIGSTGKQSLGVLPSFVMATSDAVQAYGLDHRGFVLALLRILLSFWPLLLVVAGAGFLRNAFRDKADTLPMRDKYFQNKDTACRFCCPSFDA